MFIKKSFENEIINSVEHNIQILSNKSQLEELHNKKQACYLLSLASNLLDEINLSKEAEVVTKVLEECADVKDPASEGLTSEKMLKNLEEKGWVFNAEDCNIEVTEE